MLQAPVSRSIYALSQGSRFQPTRCCILAFRLTRPDPCLLERESIATSESEQEAAVKHGHALHNDRADGHFENEVFTKRSFHPQSIVDQFKLSKILDEVA
jgi:hypothetical protein